MTRALAKHFPQCYGVDISESMIAKARELNGYIPNCKFLVNIELHLQIFSNDYFDMIYTNIVLQHVPNKFIIKSYISEFVRLLKTDGMLVFQLLSYIPFKNRLQPRRRLYAVLRMLGFNEKYLYERLGLQPQRMNFIPEKEILFFLNTLGAKVLDVQSNLAYSPSQSRTYYVTK